MRVREKADELTQSVMEPTRCLACRQLGIGETDWYDFAEIFQFPGDAISSVTQFPQQAQRYRRSWQRGTVTEAEKRAAADAARVDHARRPAHR